MAEYETKTVELVIEPETFEKTIAELTADGWRIDPSKQSTATYHVMRPKPEPQRGGVGELHIDDSKIVILRADGTLG